MNATIYSPNLFNGSMLTEARMARALTLTELGERSGITKQSISNYERGKQAPRAEYVEKLAQALEVPLGYFYTTWCVNNDSPIYFRSLASLRKNEQVKAKIKLDWFSRLLSTYEKYIDLVGLNIPQHLDISDCYLDVTSEYIEEIACRCRRYFGLGDGPISNVTMLLENNGVVITEHPVKVDKEDAYSKWVLNDKYPVVVLVSDHSSASRDRFSLAHELGHLVMHKNIQPTKKNIRLIEEQANRFASAFLLPAQSYTRDFGYPSLDVFRILKEKWKVSIQAQIIRCCQLNIISEKSKKNFYINISKRNWRKNEPLDDVLPVEHPKIVKEATKIICTEGGMSLEEMSYETFLSVKDIENLTGYAQIESVDNVPLKPKLKQINKVIPFPRK